MEHKPIYVDGVDVSKCKHFKNRTRLADYLLTDMDFSEAKCELCKDCDFKQLARKKQECDKLHSIIQKRNEEIKNLNYVLYEEKELTLDLGKANLKIASLERDIISHKNRFKYEIDKLRKELSSLLAEKNAMEIGRDEYKQECEELKKQYNCYACDTCKGKEDYINLKRHCENAIKSLHNKHAELDQLKSENKQLKKQIESDKGLITNAGKQNYQLIQEYDRLKTENDKYQLFIEKLCEYVGLECDSEEQAIKTLLDSASQMNKARWIIDRYKQTLAEIKEIAEYEFKELMNAEDYHNMTEVLKQTLQKISEDVNVNN